MIKVLIVDDSLTVREFLSGIIGSEPGMKVVGTATDGEQAVRKAVELQPDIITMDVNMPTKNGLEATREIMRTSARPIIILSQYRNSANESDVYEALEAGALSVINKPSGPGDDTSEKEIRWLLRNIRLLSEIKVITRKSVPQKRSLIGGKSLSPSAALQKTNGKKPIIAIGASTGGPAIIRQILSLIPVPYPFPIVIVQHISIGFLNGLVDWLGQGTGHDVRIAVNGAELEPGVVYFAPDDRQMLIRDREKISILDTPPDNGLRPSVASLFRSLAAENAENTVGILLSGMGTDGAGELLMLKQAGATAIIQNKETCVVFGMPGEAYKLGASDKILSPLEIGRYLTDLSLKHAKS